MSVFGELLLGLLFLYVVLHLFEIADALDRLIAP